MLIEMQLSRIIISEISESQMIFLREVGGTREFPILIGIFEATSIDRRVKPDFQISRPLTHDLIVHLAETLGASIESVTIRDLQDKTYYASLQVVRDDQTFELDARPSDAIAVAMVHQPPLPIYVAEHVLSAIDETNSL